MPRETGRDRLNGIQAARGAAAVLVVLYHGARMLSLPQYLGHTPTGIFAFGHAGVDFFFVLSGFIITFVHGDDLGRPERLRRYLRRRAMRIYPIYWVASATVILLALFSADRDERLAPIHVISSLLLVPHGQEPPLGVAWTLEHEVLFYGLFALAIFSRRLAAPLVLAAGAAIALAQVFPGNAPLRFLGDPYHLQFLMGVSAAIVLRMRQIPGPRILAACAIVAFGLSGAGEDFGLFKPAGLTSKLLFGMASTGIVISIAAAELQGRTKAGAIASLFGSASYSIYLIHAITIGLTARLLTHIGLIAVAPDWALFALVCGLAVVSGFLLHICVEQPLMGGFRRFRFAPSWPGARRVPARSS